MNHKHEVQKREKVLLAEIEESDIDLMRSRCCRVKT